MHIAARIALAVVIVALDFASFMVPLGALAIAWMIVARPRAALVFIAKIYEGKEFAPEGEAAAAAREGPPADRN